MRQHLLATAPSGKTYRWGEDEPLAEQVLDNLSDEDTMPGGDKELTVSLPRKPGVDYGDMVRGTYIELFGAGNYKVWGGRLERAPRTSGDYLTMDPAAVGYQAHLADDESAQEIFIDRDLGGWGEPTTQRKIDLLAAIFAGRPYALSMNVLLAPNGSTLGPAISFQLSTVAEGTSPIGESWFYGGGVDIGAVRFDYRSLPGFAEDVNYLDRAFLSPDDIASSTAASSTYHQAPAATNQELAAPGAGYKYVLFQSFYAAPLNGTYRNENAFVNPIVLGRHGLSVYG